MYIHGIITIQELEDTFITSVYKRTAFRIQKTHTHTDALTRTDTCTSLPHRNSPIVSRHFLYSSPFVRIAP